MIVKKEEGKPLELGEEIWTFYLTGDDTDGRFDLVQGEVGYLQGPPLHVHFEQDDTFMVLEGTLTVQVGDEIYDLEPGDVACAKKGTPHTYTNLKEEKVKIMNLMTPGGFDKALKEFSKLPPEAINPETLEPLTKKYKMQIVGPPIPVKLGLV